MPNGEEKKRGIKGSGSSNKSSGKANRYKTYRDETGAFDQRDI